MPIYFADLHEPLIIKQITGDDKVRAHLLNLGFTVGESVMVINKVDENVIVKIKGISMAISSKLAKRIIV